MNHRLLIRVLELLEETYPECYYVERLIKKLNIFSYDGEFSKVIRYLKDKNKIDVSFRDFDGAYPQWRRLQQGDKISITPNGIDFLTEIKLIETNKKINNRIMWATMIIALATIINIIITILLYFIKSK